MTEMGTFQQNGHGKDDRDERESTNMTQFQQLSKFTGCKITPLSSSPPSLLRTLHVCHTKIPFSGTVHNALVFIPSTFQSLRHSILDGTFARNKRNNLWTLTKRTT